MRGLLLAALAVLLTSTQALGDIYRVRPGDSLYKIAKKFHTTVRKIMRVNGLRHSRIRVGQRLIIPGTKHTPSWYRKFKPQKSRQTIAFLERKSQREMASQIVGKEINPITNVVYRESELISQFLSTPLNVKYDNWSLSILNNPEYKGALLKLLAKIFKKLKNTPYVFGGNSPNFGLDCSSFTMYVYRKLGINLPRTARAQFNTGIPVDLKHLKVGDLVFFRTYARYPSHVGIYIGNGKFIHFSSMFHGLAISSLKNRYFRKRFIGARRVLSEKRVQRILYSLNNK